MDCTTYIKYLDDNMSPRKRSKIQPNLTKKSDKIDQKDEWGPMKKWSNDSKFLAGAYPHQITYLCVAIQDSNKFDQKSEKLVRKISFYDSKTLIGAYPHPNIQY